MYNYISYSLTDIVTDPGNLYIKLHNYTFLHNWLPMCIELEIISSDHKGMNLNMSIVIA